MLPKSRLEVSMTDFDPIWAANAGDSLEARVTLHMEDGDQAKVFTAGQRYVVLSVLPLRVPAAAVVLDDTDHENKIEAEFLGNFIHLPK